MLGLETKVGCGELDFREAVAPGSENFQVKGLRSATQCLALNLLKSYQHWS